MCPYDGDGVRIDRETYEAGDGHNVSVLTPQDVEQLRTFIDQLRPAPVQATKRKRAGSK